MSASRVTSLMTHRVFSNISASRVANDTQKLASNGIESEYSQLLSELTSHLATN
ncbi:hypothetical protein DAPPUDRAFT_272763 [Daphnia pulex]|uniref:Uncharacterized protein n=1 Tax=Daphnia pulex TaxID=6669 RepID=E9I366_DAPPU|nr:hypothetical protein DAPPUDRAFT_272763 [Daphnia pulex]|eukprot:EFX61564.1 hypothetical protein DAPPUDRAFT_272763 [Daphnia pulex]